MLRAAAAIVVVGAMVPGGAGVDASVVVPMSLAQLVEAASLIVDATVADVRHVEGPDGAERLVLVRVAATWKGSVEGTAYVRLPGGRIGRYETRIAGVPSVDAGDRLVWFLTPHQRGGYSVLGLHQGAMRTSEAPGRETLVMAPAPAATARGDLARLPRRLADLAIDVRALVGRETDR
jgi:hypothetical protein